MLKHYMLLLRTIVFLSNVCTIAYKDKATTVARRLFAESMRGL